MCTERKATGLFVLADFLCDNGSYTYVRSVKTQARVGICTVSPESPLLAHSNDAANG